MRNSDGIPMLVEKNEMVFLMNKINGFNIVFFSILATSRLLRLITNRCYQLRKICLLSFVLPIDTAKGKK